MYFIFNIIIYRQIFVVLVGQGKTVVVTSLEQSQYHAGFEKTFSEMVIYFSISAWSKKIIFCPFCPKSVQNFVPFFLFVPKLVPFVPKSLSPTKNCKKSKEKRDTVFLTVKCARKLDTCPLNVSFFNVLIVADLRSNFRRTNSVKTTCLTFQLSKSQVRQQDRVLFHQHNLRLCQLSLD